VKKGDTFKLDYAWWDKERPKALLPTGLGAALKAYATAVTAFDTTTNGKTYDTAKAALEQVDKARLKAIKLCLATFPVEKTVLTAGSHVIQHEETRLLQVLNDKLVNAAARMKKLTESSAANVTKFAPAVESLAGKLFAATDNEALGKLLKSAVEVVYYLESAASFLADVDPKSRPLCDIIRFSVDENLIHAMTQAKPLSKNAKSAADTLRNAIDTTAGRAGLDVKYLATH
jgi:hypothetical protein